MRLPLSALIFALLLASALTPRLSAAPAAPSTECLSVVHSAHQSGHSRCDYGEARLHQPYLANNDPQRFSVPTPFVMMEMFDRYATGLQRAIVHAWKQTVPRTRDARMTMASRGEFAREFGLIPMAALIREPHAPAVLSDKPARLRIPSLGVNSAIEHVGLDARLAVGVPADVMNAAWWQDGPIPGNPGNAILVGHLDDFRGAPAVFWDLHKLAVGDRVTVAGENGTEQTFEVIEVAVYRFDDLSVMDKIYGRTDERNLNIITCNGKWDDATRNYENRLVVYTRLVS